MSFTESPLRSEIKYLVPDRLVSELRQAIAPMVQPDKHAEGFLETGYTVRSIYLDTSRLRYYHEKIDGIKDRKKLRVRAYNASRDTTFLEIKRKVESRIKKDRAALPFKHVISLFNDPHRSDLASMLHKPDSLSSASSFLYHLFKENLHPVNLVVYEREAFEGKIDPTLRITFDKNLRSRLCSEISWLFSEEDMRQVLPGHFILEIKYNYSFPSWLTPVLSGFKLQKQALSKYCMSLELCEGSLEKRSIARPYV